MFMVIPFNGDRSDSRRRPDRVHGGGVAVPGAVPMSETFAGVLFVASLIVALAVSYRSLGDYMYAVVAGGKHSRAERGVYRLVGVDPSGGQTWGVYARSVLAFSAVGILFLYAFLRLQDVLPLSLGFDGVMAHGAWNTAVSFVTNTNWQ
jgi:potassium-transporting ATPase potassium-binding subunit